MCLYMYKTILYYKYSSLMQFVQDLLSNGPVLSCSHQDINYPVSCSLNASNIPMIVITDSLPNLEIFLCEMIIFP